MGRREMVRKMTENEFEFISKKIVDVHEIEVQKAFRDPEKVRRILLKTNEGNISYRPFRYVDEKKEIHGFNVRQRKQEMLTIEELPKVLWELKDKLKSGAGLCKVKLSYFLWNKEVDGQIIPIRFMKEKQVNEVEFVELEEKVT